MAGDTVYRAAEGFADDLRAELGPGAEEVGPDLFRLRGPPVPAAWAADVWFDVEELPVASIGAAAGLLRERQAWWAHEPIAEVRRGALIGDRLPRRREREFRVPPSRRPLPLGAYGLRDRDRMLAGPRTQRPFAGGVPPLFTDREGPPSRAYRKCWEALLLLGDRPRAGERVWDLGAAPGAWSWALAGCDCEVLAVDKAPLDPAIAALPGVAYREGSAFAMDPTRDPVDWIFSDVVCYPGRLLKAIERWLAAGCERLVVTVKFQGDTDAESVRALRALPRSQLLHLHHNKHELTWIRHPDLRGPRPLAWPWVPGGDRE